LNLTPSKPCNGAQRLMSRSCLMASSCDHLVTSYLNVCSSLGSKGIDLLDATLEPNINGQHL